MDRSIHFLVLVATFLASCSVALAKPQPIRLIQSEIRYGYEVELLKHVLDLTEDEFGPAEAIYIEREPGKPHLEQYLAQDKFDVAFFPTSPRKERMLRPIKIPLLQGMFGYRLLLIKPDMEQKITDLTNLKDFKERLIGGVGLRWETFKIFSHNKLLMKASMSRAKLYDMLIRGELDYFARGVNEIFGESMQFYAYHEALKTSKQIAFYCPNPFYFFVPPDRAELANRIEKGLKMAENDGSFKKIFIKHFSEEIEYLRQYPVRDVLYLENPAGYVQQPMNFDWWLDEPSKLRP